MGQAASIPDEAAFLREKRRFVRKTLSSTVSVFDVDSHQHLGLLIDISRGGAMITSYFPLSANTDYQLNLVDLPDNSERKRTGQLQARSVWCHKTNPSMYCTGFEFIDLSEEAEKMIRSY